MKSVSVLGLVALAAPGLAQTVDLASAAGFGLLAPKSIVSSGATSIHGNIGTESTELTGFPPGTLTGITETDSTTVDTAVTDANNARIAALALTPDTTLSALDTGVTLTPGIYTFGASGETGGGGGGGTTSGGGGTAGGPGRRVKRQGQGGGASGGGGGTSGGGGGGGVGVAAPIVFAGNVTFDGAGTYIIQGADSMTVEAGANVILKGGALSENIWWVLDATVTIEGDVTFKGNILAASDIGIGAGTAVNGGIFSGAAITISDSIAGLVTPAHATTSAAAA